MGLFSGFNKIGKSLKKNWSNAINEGGQVIKKVGEFSKPIARGLQVASFLIGTPAGQMLLYGTGALFGPAGIAVANAINIGSKAVLIGTSAGFGLESIYEGSKGIAEAGNRNDFGGILKGTGRLVLGLASFAGVGRNVGKGFTNPNPNTKLLVNANKGRASLTTNTSKHITDNKIGQKYRELVGWNKPQTLGYKEAYSMPPKAGIEASKRYVSQLPKGRSISIKYPKVPRSSTSQVRQAGQEEIRAYGSGAPKHPNFSPQVTSSYRPQLKTSRFERLGDEIKSRLPSFRSSGGYKKLPEQKPLEPYNPISGERYSQSKSFGELN
jgi:hypothetical protein